MYMWVALSMSSPPAGLKICRCRPPRALEGFTGFENWKWHFQSFWGLQSLGAAMNGLCRSQNSLQTPPQHSSSGVQRLEIGPNLLVWIPTDLQVSMDSQLYFHVLACRRLCLHELEWCGFRISPSDCAPGSLQYTPPQRQKGVVGKCRIVVSNGKRDAGEIRVKRSKYDRTQLHTYRDCFGGWLELRSKDTMLFKKSDIWRRDLEDLKEDELRCSIVRATPILSSGCHISTKHKASTFITISGCWILLGFHTKRIKQISFSNL